MSLSECSTCSLSMGSTVATPLSTFRVSLIEISSLCKNSTKLFFPKICCFTLVFFFFSEKVLPYQKQV